MLPHSALTQCWGSKFKSICLEDEHLISWATSPAHKILFNVFKKPFGEAERNEGRLGQASARDSLREQPAHRLFFSFMISWNAGSPTRKCGLELLNSRFGKWKDKTWRCVVINLEAQFFSPTVCWLISKDKLQNPWTVARDNEQGLAF